MADVVKSIGTAGRDYSTVTLWEADLDNASIYASGDVAIGEMYNDSNFDESVTINGGGTVGLSGRILRPAAGHRHNGTPGTGVRFVMTNNAGRVIAIGINATVIDGIEVDYNGGFQAVANAIVIGTGASATAPMSRFQRCFAHNIVGTQATSSGRRVFAIDNGFGIIQNCAAWNVQLTNTNTGVFGAFHTANSSGNQRIYNCTAVNVRRHSGSGVGRGLSQTTNNIMSNCVGASITGTTSGTKRAFQASTTTTISYSLSDDDSADDAVTNTGAIINANFADLFVSNVSGAEDLNLKAGSPAIGMAFDRGNTDDIHLSLNGVDRDADGGTWDMGAYEYVASASITLEGFIVGDSSASGLLSTAITLAGSASGVATASADLSTSIRLAGAATGAATATAAVSTAVALSATATGQATATASLSTEVRMSGAAVGQATATAALSTAIPLAGTASGTSTATAALSAPAELTGTATGTSTATASLSTAVTLAGAVTGVASASAGLSTAVTLSGVAAGASAASAALNTAIGFNGTATGTSTATAALQTAVQAAGAAIGTATAVGTLSTSIALAGAAAGVSQASADLQAGFDFVELPHRWGLAARWQASMATQTIDAVAARYRDARFQGGDMRYTKRSDGAVRVGVDWSKALRPNNATITSSSWHGAGLTFTDPDEEATRATVVVEGGTAGQTYPVRNRIETSDGQTLDSDKTGAPIDVVIEN